MRTHFEFLVLVTLLLQPVAILGADNSRASVKISVDWQQPGLISKTTASTFVLGGTPVIRQTYAIREGVFSALQELDTRYVRYMQIGTYPRLAVAELEPPTTKGTSWDFYLLDPELVHFLDLTKGREPLIDVAEIPAWMFQTRKPISYPADPNELAWHYMFDKLEADEPHSSHKKLTLVDPTGEQIAEYYARIFSWYTRGGFTDENGQFHRSDHHYDIPWWEVFNELDGQLSAEQYVTLYDQIVERIHRISPRTRFVGLSLGNTAFPAGVDDIDADFIKFIEYFLNPKNHQSGIPLDMISYHFYAVGSSLQGIDSLQYTFFDQADGFLTEASFIEAVRKHLSPSTRVDWDEIGSVLYSDLYASRNDTSDTVTAIPLSYWNLSGALYAYLYLQGAKRGIDVVGASMLTGYPGNFPSVALVNAKTGKPNAYYRVLEMLKEVFGPGDQLVFTDQSGLLSLDVRAQGFITARGRKLLIINKRARPIEIDLQGVGVLGEVEVVDTRSQDGPPRREAPQGNSLLLRPFAVAVVT